MIWQERIVLPKGIMVHNYQIQENGIIILFLHNKETNLWAAAVYDSKTSQCLEIDIFSKKRLALACFVDRLKIAVQNPEITDWVFGK